MKVSDCIERDLGNEPQSVVKVYERETLRTDLAEYVLTDVLAKEFGKVFERVIEPARPSSPGSEKIGIWVSGFFGSGKSHFAKLAGHLLADTDLGGQGARDLFRVHLHPDRASDQRLREVFQEAANYRLSCHLVAFDISAIHSAAADHNVGLTFLRAFYESLGLSKVIAFAERELELQTAGKYEQFRQLYAQKTQASWDEDRDLTLSSVLFAQCLAELLPHRYSTVELAHQSLELALRNVEKFYNVETIVECLLRWLEARQKVAADKAPLRLLFVADEVGAWAGADLRRIEQLRSLVETLGVKGQGRIWLMVTSQEKLSAVVQNTTSDRDLLQRLEARFRTNVHLESSEVGAVIEDRILRKKPATYPQLEQLWSTAYPMLIDVGESPGLDLGANYPGAERGLFVRSYPLLPYQLPAAADIFGGMRGIKVSSGARSMIKVAFDAARTLADRDLGALVSWDQVFDSANRDNEFADEQYLGSQGLQYLLSADTHVVGAPVAKPSRLLKILWLVGKSSRIPRTVRNLARLLVDGTGQNILQLEQDVATTLIALAERDFVRQDVATGQWKFLTQDEVTVEKIVRRIAEDLKANEVRKEIFELHSRRLQALFGGKITNGKSNTSFTYGLFLNDQALKNEEAPVRMRAALAGSPAADRAKDEYVCALEEPVVFWQLDRAPKLDERLRRAMAIDRLPEDKEFRDKATAQTKAEAAKLETEAVQLRQAAETEVESIFQGGTLLYGGQEVDLRMANGGAKARVEAAIRDRIEAKYTRFREGDMAFNAANVDKLFVVFAVDRGKLDPGLGLFSADGHVHGGNVLVEALTLYLKSNMKNAGADVVEHFAQPVFGWPADLLRYVAAAMFVDGKLSLQDKPGKRYDNPKDAAARALFGTAAFKAAYLDIEEDSLTPAESTQARTLLSDLGHKPFDGGEIALKEATQALAIDLTRRSAILERAKGVMFPLPEGHEGIPLLVETIGQPGSRVKVVRAALARESDLRSAAAALTELEKFEKGAGFDQYRRTRQLLAAALQAGLEDDPSVGDKVRNGHEQIESLCAQRRVLEEWGGSFTSYRLDLIECFRAVYQPLRERLAERVKSARDALTAMAEYELLPLGDRTTVRVRFLNDGKPLQALALPDLKGDHDLLAANAQYSVAHLQASLAALDSQLAAARTMVIELYGRHLKQKGEEERTATWPAAAFAGKRFETEKQVDETFDSEKERIKVLIRQGKSVQVV